MTFFRSQVSEHNMAILANRWQSERRFRSESAEITDIINPYTPKNGAFKHDFNTDWRCRHWLGIGLGLPPTLRGPGQLQKQIGGWKRLEKRPLLREASPKSRDPQADCPSRALPEPSRTIIPIHSDSRREGLLKVILWRVTYRYFKAHTSFI